MRQQFESELQAARGEVAIAQEALEGAEERVRASERAERAQAEAEYVAAIQALQAGGLPAWGTCSTCIVHYRGQHHSAGCLCRRACPDIACVCTHMQALPLPLPLPPA